MSVFAVDSDGHFDQFIMMSANELMAEIKALPPPEQQKLARMLVAETDWLEDVLDAAIAKSRMNEPERPIEMLLREQELME